MSSLGTCRVTCDGALHAAPQAQELIQHGSAQVTGEKWDPVQMCGGSITFPRLG